MRAAMKGNSSKAKGPKPSQTTNLVTSDKVMIRTDLGDKTSRYCGPNSAGEVLVEGACPTTKIGLTQQFGAMARCRIAIKVGTHSPWGERGAEAVTVKEAAQSKLA